MTSNGAGSQVGLNRSSHEVTSTSVSSSQNMNAITSRGTTALTVKHAAHTTTVPAHPAANLGALPRSGCPPTTKATRSDQPAKDSELRGLIFEAKAREHQTLQPCPLWGRAGELYAAQRFGLTLSRSHTQGHDGRLGNDLVEIKTITPLKRKPFVRVKRSGNFNVIAVVRVLPDHQFEARLVRRDRLPKGRGGEYFVLPWSKVCALAESN